LHFLPGCSPRDLRVYDKIALSIAAYERGPEVSRFSSKFDVFWGAAKAKGKNVAGIRMGNWQNYRRLGLTDSELQGLASFNDPNRANCTSCHSLQPGAQGYPLFTDFGYDNLGIPKNPANPASIADPTWADPGLGGYLKDASQVGKFKVPTLRNADLRPSSTFVKAYGHNGYFKSLDDIVFFYHWRAMIDSGGMGGGGMGPGGGGGGGGMGGMSNRYPPPEVNANRTLLQPFPGMDVSYIVSFLKTLSDGYR
jgi:cytochrome c peroxidase